MIKFYFLDTCIELILCCITNKVLLDEGSKLVNNSSVDVHSDA